MGVLIVLCGDLPLLARVPDTKVLVSSLSPEGSLVGGGSLLLIMTSCNQSVASQISLTNERFS